MCIRNYQTLSKQELVHHLEMKLLVLFALFALTLNVVNVEGHCSTCGVGGDHDDAHDEMTCPEGEVAVMGYGADMVCVG